MRIEDSFGETTAAAWGGVGSRRVLGAAIGTGADASRTTGSARSAGLTPTGAARVPEPEPAGDRANAAGRDPDGGGANAARDDVTGANRAAVAVAVAAAVATPAAASVEAPIRAKAGAIEAGAREGGVEVGTGPVRGGQV